MSHQQVYKLPPMLVNGQLRNGSSAAASASANNGGDGDKIRQLQRLLLGVTKAIQTYLLEDIGAPASLPVCVDLFDRCDLLR